jgi:hypothetical protein
MRKKIVKLIFVLLLVISGAVHSQPPPPPPDPDGLSTDPYPPGWVGKSPVGDGAMILIAFALAYGLKKYLDNRKEKKAESKSTEPAL